MVIKDSVAVKRALKGQAQEAYAHQVNQWTQEQLGGASVVTNIYDSELNPKRQLGRELPNPEALEVILKKLSPNFVFEASPNPTKKRLRFQVPGEVESRYICLYENGPMPEYSIMNAQWRWEPDPDFALGLRKIERSEVRGTPVTLQQAYDLIRDKGIDGAKAELLQRRADSGQNDPDYKPGFRKVLKKWNEAVRGWRPVLAMIVQSGLVGLNDIQRTANELRDPTTVRASWAKVAVPLQR